MRLGCRTGWAYRSGVAADECRLASGVGVGVMEWRLDGELVGVQTLVLGERFEQIRNNCAHLQECQYD